MLKFTNYCLISVTIFSLFLLLFVGISSWRSGSENERLKKQLKENQEKSQNYRETIKMLEIEKNTFERELKAKDNRSMSLIKIKGTLENSVALCKSENSKLRFDSNNTEAAIRRKVVLFKDTLVKVKEIQKIFEKVGEEEERMLRSFQVDKSSVIEPKLMDFKDFQRFHRDEVEGMMASLVNTLENKVDV